MSSSCQTPDFASMTEHIIYDSSAKMTRCSSCGNLGIFTAIKKALTAQWLKPHEVVIAFDVWCSGNGSDKIMANTIHGLHGRVIPLARGFQLGNTQIPVLAMEPFVGLRGLEMVPHYRSESIIWSMVLETILMSPSSCTTIAIMVWRPDKHPAPLPSDKSWTVLSIK